VRRSSCFLDIVIGLLMKVLHNILLFQARSPSPRKVYYYYYDYYYYGHDVAQLVEALCYKPEGSGFDSRKGN
jgi:hypothetical protein